MQAVILVFVPPIERDQIGFAALYVGASVVLGVHGLWAGMALIRSYA